MGPGVEGDTIAVAVPSLGGGVVVGALLGEHLKDLRHGGARVRLDDGQKVARDGKHAEEHLSRVVLARHSRYVRGPALGGTHVGREHGQTQLPALPRGQRSHATTLPAR